MLDIKSMAEDTERYQRLLASRDPAIDISDIVERYKKMTSLQSQYEAIRHEHKERSRRLGMDVEKGSAAFKNERTSLASISSELSDMEKVIEKTRSEIEMDLMVLPNILLPSVPISQDKDDKEIIRVYGEKRVFDFPVRDHLELAERLEIIDFQRAGKISGAAFPLYVGRGAQLEWALLNYMIDGHISKGFKFMLPPVINNTASLKSTGTLPKFRDQIYSCKDDDLHLIPTAEVPLTNLHRGELLDERDLPLRYAAYTPNFRREAGSYGKRDRGLMRLHQFNKVELYSISAQENSEEELEMLVLQAEEVLKGLGLHYRITNLASCDLAHQSAKTYDIEVWLPFADYYSEVSSASNCLDYQARRADIRYKGKGRKRYAHTLNCSGLATPRLYIALLEANQTEDGHVVVPEKLRKYTGFEII